jgi:polyisoprenoid-binding protein YceI
MNREAKRLPRGWGMRVGRILAYAVLLAACRAPLESRPGSAAPRPPAAAETERYEVDAERSRLILRVYRDGPLAALGHNHVIAVHGLEGSVRWHPDPEQCSVALRFAVAALGVDEPELRAAAGADFATPLDEAARTGTRRNMLGPRLLDADRFPEITLVSKSISGSASAPRIALRAYVAGRDVLLDVPAQLWRDAEGIRATGAFELRQTTLGLTPFSTLLGALRVADTLQVQFDIRARPLRGAAGDRAS